ncbi:hypothetical protein PAECIP111893_01952 [Paenibacillus plantiphilus]|uniref:Uncharacterized protein n=1 Tax=Paenibacillus plantiphilus TaxID=2905650 RepID=A0ABN8G988_9BACL|nr:hypothetical protein [Paenibacillus plantiphilus]CAH1203364.1 hypothetical protein PAECIP111893_01952 [Paenibacillus plantiphilus]
MPFNKSEKKDNQRNEASFEEPAITTKPEKTGQRPPSLNNINKQQQ